MESPVVVDKPPEYHGNSRNSDERGFPFDEEDSAGAWSSLAARHPDIAARLRQRPATWARKRRPPSQTSADDFDENFEGFDRFPFDDIPPEFREHFPSHWNRGFGSREEQPHGAPPPQQQQHQPQQQPSSPQTTSTQTEEQEPDQPHLPQYGLRNTVDLGQKSAADPSLVDADDRNQRSMSAPPDSRTMNQEHQAPEQPASNVRHIPIFVEGRDEPVINKNVDHGAHYADPKPQYASPPKHPQQPHIDREQYFADDGPASFHHAPNFSRAFGTPFNKNYRQGPQPFVHQKVYPQAAFARGASPARSESPKPQPHPHDEHYVNVPVHHEPPKPEPSRAQQRPQPPQPPQRQPSPQQQTPPQPQAPPQPKPQPPMNDPISQILSIQTDVLNLMSEVENFGGAKNDKQYLYLDEMLTRNLIKLDNIETDGKENIRQARKEAIKCIQKCIAVLEAKAESNSKAAKGTDVEMKEKAAAENGEVVTKEATKDEVKAEVGATEPKPEADKTKEAEPTPLPSDTRPDDKAPEATPETTADTKQVDNKPSPKKGAKDAKKRDKSKDNADKSQESTSDEKQEAMQVDDKGDKTEPQTMDVDGASASQ